MDRIRTEGPLGFDEVMGLALDRFFAGGGAAGRRGDFLTSPEVGPLFGAVVARALDAWWDEQGRPDPYVVAEAGAGVGTLWRSVRRSEPRCAGALRHLLVERSEALRAHHPEGASSQADLAGVGPAHVVLANELLDNLPCRLRQDDQEVRVGLDAGGALAFVPEPTLGCVPEQAQARAWLQAAIDVVAATGGRMVVLDYASTTADLAARPWTDWLRTYAGHDRGGHPLEHLGGQDITVEVCVDQLATVRSPDTDRSQADFLRAHGIEALVAEGRERWAERAAVGDLEALAARSRVSEAEALLDPAGLGAFRVLEWTLVR